MVPRDQTIESPGEPKPITKAKNKTEHVKRELEIAGAEIHLTNTILDSNLPKTQRTGDVGKALEQNEVVEASVVHASKELHEVKELLEEEISERHRLERELARRPPSDLS